MMKTLIVLPLCACAALALAEETVYSWTDADGVTHYSNTAPAQVPAAAVEEIDLDEKPLSVIGDAELRPAEQETLDTMLENIDRDALQPAYPPRTRVVTVPARSGGGVGTTGVVVGDADVNGNLSNPQDNDRDNDGVLDALEDRTTGPTDIPPQISTIDAGIPPQISTTGDERFATPTAPTTPLTDSDFSRLEEAQDAQNAQNTQNAQNAQNATNTDASTLENRPAARATGGAITANESNSAAGGAVDGSTATGSGAGRQ